MNYSCLCASKQFALPWGGRRSPFRVRLVSVLLTASLVAFSSDSLASRWRGSAGLATQMYYTDNINLQPINQESDVVFQMTPFVRLNRSGKNVSLNLSYGPSFNFYQNDSDRNQLFHILRASSTVILIEDYLSIRFSARANHFIIDPRRNAGFSSISLPDSRTQTFFFDVTPVLNLPLIRNGRFANLTIVPGLRFSYVADTVDGSEGRSDTGDTSISIKSGSDFTRFIWSLRHTNQVFNRDADNAYQQTFATLGYNINQWHSVSSDFGYSTRSFGRNLNNPDNSGEFFYRLNWNWRPGPRTSLGLGFGEEYFGNSYRMNFSHRQQHWVFGMGFVTDIGNARTELASTDTVAETDAFGNPLTDPLFVDSLEAPVGSPGLTNATYVRYGFNASLGWRRKRNSVNFTGNYDLRNYDAGGQDTLDWVARLVYARDLATNLSANLSYRFWRRADGGGGELSSDFLAQEAGFSINRQVGPRTSLNVNVTHQTRDYQQSIRSFGESRVFLGVTFSL